MDDWEVIAEDCYLAADSYSDLQVEVVPRLLRALYWQNKAIIELLKGNRTNG